MLIGKLSALTGFSKDTIRYYEKIGLIQSAGYNRQSNNYKNYSNQTQTRLQNIRELKEAGFTLTEITHLLDTMQGTGHPCADLPEKLVGKLAKINAQIEVLEKNKNAVENIIASCSSQCEMSDGLPSCVRCH